MQASSFTHLGRPDTRHVATQHGYLAYQAFGSGDRGITFITGAITNEGPCLTGWESREECGSIELVGVQGTWRLFEVTSLG
ncbi:MAG: hypothetical protein R6W79_06200 [Acidimicrobiia bacterium]